jgi:GNAT superfamily N-acetyltransferase
MPDDVQIKQFELHELESLLSFLRIAYAGEPRKSDPAYWNWHYLENPYTAKDDIPVWVVKDGERVVGQAATILVELKVAEETRRGVWILEFVLLPEYRGRKLGKRLLMLAREKYPTMLALGYNELSGNVLRSLDWVSMGTIRRYHRLLYPGNAVRAVKPVRELLNLGYSPLRPTSLEKSPSHRFTIRELANFDASFDDLWRRASGQWPCAVIRSSSFLEWQFRRQPGKTFEVLGLYNDKQLLGYVVMYFRKAGPGGASPKAAISDLCYDPETSEQVIDDLLKAALRLAIERRAGSLVTDVLDARVEQRLKQLGFWRIKAAPPFMLYSPTQQELTYDPGNWFLTRADSDVSICEEPNE